MYLAKKKELDESYSKSLRKLYDSYNTAIKQVYPLPDRSTRKTAYNETDLLQRKQKQGRTKLLPPPYDTNSLFYYWNSSLIHNLRAAEKMASLSARQNDEVGFQIDTETGVFEMKKKEIMQRGKALKLELKEAFARVKKEEDSYSKAQREHEEMRKQVQKLQTAVTVKDKDIMKV